MPTSTATAGALKHVAAGRHCQALLRRALLPCSLGLQEGKQQQQQGSLTRTLITHRACLPAAAASPCKPWTPATSAWWRCRCVLMALNTIAATATSAWVSMGARLKYTLRDGQDCQKRDRRCPYCLVASLPFQYHCKAGALGCVHKQQ